MSVGREKDEGLWFFLLVRGKNTEFINASPARIALQTSKVVVSVPYSSFLHKRTVAWSNVKSCNGPEFTVGSSLSLMTRVFLD